MRPSVFTVVALLAVVHGASSMCSMLQPCYGVPDGCHPVAATYEPFAMNYSDPACPKYQDSACCNQAQNDALLAGQALIRSVYGGATGCGACEQNMFDLWCDMICAPNQADFMLPLGLANVSSPWASGNITALQLQLTVSKEAMTDLYASCSYTGDVKANPSLQSPFLLFNATMSTVLYWGMNVVAFEGTNANTMPYTPQPCNKFTNATTGHASACPCATCEASCK